MSLRKIFTLPRIGDEGFSLAEVTVALLVATVMIGVMFSVTFFYYANAVQSQETALLALDSQTILSQMVEDLRLADGISATNSIADTYAPSGGWTTNDPSNIIIIRYPATDTNRDIIYDPNSGYPYRNEYIYFLSGTTMYKRILKNTNATGNTVTQTCPKASATTLCPPDKTFSSNVSDLTFTFYDANNATTADPTQARSVKLTLTMQKKVFGRLITLSNSTQITQRNV
jgi:Tfp pilus assembly protein PilV